MSAPRLRRRRTVRKKYCAMLLPDALERLGQARTAKLVALLQERERYQLANFGIVQVSFSPEREVKHGINIDGSEFEIGPGDIEVLELLQ